MAIHYAQKPMSQVLWYHLILTTTPWSRDNYLFLLFFHEKIKIQRCWETCPSTHSKSVTKSEFKTTSVWFQTLCVLPKEHCSDKIVTRVHGESVLICLFTEAMGVPSGQGQVCLCSPLRPQNLVPMPDSQRWSVRINHLDNDELLLYEVTRH